MQSHIERDRFHWVQHMTSNYFIDLWRLSLDFAKTPSPKENIAYCNM
jgi:hypothetical protein